MSGTLKEYTHYDLNQEVTAIGGHYIIVKEERLPFTGQEVLYIVGYAIFDTTCCGSGGCNYAQVPGFIVNWKNKKDEEGLSISEITPVTDKSDQKKIRRLIEEKETVTQVNFY